MYLSCSGRMDRDAETSRASERAVVIGRIVRRTSVVSFANRHVPDHSQRSGSENHTR